MKDVMDKEIQEILENHEKRLQRLENLIAGSKKSKPQKAGLLALFQVLKDEGFFSQERTPTEILHRLAEKGHTYKRVQSLTEPLQRATKQGILNRKKKESGWVYYS